MGLEEAYPSVKQVATAAATDKWAPVEQNLKSHCAFDAVLTGAGHDYLGNNTYFRGGLDLLVDPTVRVSLTCVSWPSLNAACP